MPVNDTYYPTMATVAKRLDPDGKVDKIVEILNETNEILTDMVMLEGNLPTGHRGTIRTGLPEATWRKLNYGVMPDKSETAQVTDTCGMLESYAEVDKALADLNGNTAAFRLSEDRAFLESMNQSMATTLFYGDTAKNPERFLGLSARYNSLNTTKNKLAKYVIDAGGRAGTDVSLGSIWFICWGPNTMHGIYPKGSKVGWQHSDLGEVTLNDKSGGRYQGYRTHYKWDIGLHVRDYRYAVRIANIDKRSVDGNALIDNMILASELLHDKRLGRPAIYMTRSLRTLLRQTVVNRKNVIFNFDNYEGRTVMSFDDIPVRICDVLEQSEAQVA